jgi:hypothetical protein
MPVLGLGTLPSGAAGTELQSVTRRAIMPAVVVQIGKSTPTLSSMLAAAEPVSGGVSPITFPVQGSRMVSGGFTDYSGAFNAPQILTGLSNAEYNLKAFVVGIPYYMFEGLVQMDAEIVPILWARMNDAGNYVSDQFATFMWAALSANTALQINSLNDLVSTGNPTQGNVGNIDRTANSFWQSNQISISTINVSSSAVSRVNVLAAVNYGQKAAGGEAPTCGICSPGFWSALAADAITGERYIVNKEGTYADHGEGATIGFPAINVGGIPIYADIYYPDNTSLTLLNFNYLGFKIHQDAAFAIAGPESMLPQFQLGYIMALFVLLENVTSKPAALAKIQGFTGAYAI